MQQKPRADKVIRYMDYERQAVKAKAREYLIQIHTDCLMKLCIVRVFLRGNMTRSCLVLDLDLARITS